MHAFWGVLGLRATRALTNACDARTAPRLDNGAENMHDSNMERYQQSGCRYPL
jgi:hypothetical protein